MKITAHFDSHMWACPDSAAGTPYPSKWIEPRLRPLCESAEVVWAALEEATGLKVRIIVTKKGGYRTEAFNRRINGARYSQHVEGRAMDFVVQYRAVDKWADLNPRTVQRIVLDLIRTGKLPKVHGLGHYPNFTHIDVRPAMRLSRWYGSRKEEETWKKIDADPVA